jgi:hypothetical protein
MNRIFGIDLLIHKIMQQVTREMMYLNKQCYAVFKRGHQYGYWMDALGKNYTFCMIANIGLERGDYDFVKYILERIMSELSRDVWLVKRVMLIVSAIYWHEEAIAAKSWALEFVKKYHETLVFGLGIACNDIGPTSTEDILLYPKVLRDAIHKYVLFDDVVKERMKLKVSRDNFWTLRHYGIIDINNEWLFGKDDTLIRAIQNTLLCDNFSMFIKVITNSKISQSSVNNIIEYIFTFASVKFIKKFIKKCVHADTERDDFIIILHGISFDIYAELIEYCVYMREDIGLIKFLVRKKIIFRHMLRPLDGLKIGTLEDILKRFDRRVIMGWYKYENFYINFAYRGDIVGMKELEKIKCYSDMGYVVMALYCGSWKILRKEARSIASYYRHARNIIKMNTDYSLLISPDPEMMEFMGYLDKYYIPETQMGRDLPLRMAHLKHMHKVIRRFKRESDIYL